MNSYEIIVFGNHATILISVSLCCWIYALLELNKRRGGKGQVATLLSPQEA